MGRKQSPSPRSIRAIAAEIQRVWGSNVHYAAAPYLAAMISGGGDVEMLVLYFQSNAGTFRGEDARRLKAELKASFKECLKLEGLLPKEAS